MTEALPYQQPVEKPSRHSSGDASALDRFASSAHYVNAALHYVMYSIHSALPRLRSALLLGRIALPFTSRRALPARRLAALGARGALSTDSQEPADKIPPAFERRCIRAGRFARFGHTVNFTLQIVMYTIRFARSRLRSALLLGRIAVLFALRRALPARRLPTLGARAALSTDCSLGTSPT